MPKSFIIYVLTPPGRKFPRIRADFDTMRREKTR
jgi:hypothetical protein